MNNHGDGGDEDHDNKGVVLTVTTNKVNRIEGRIQWGQYHHFNRFMFLFHFLSINNC